MSGLMLRTPPERMDPVPLSVGDSVQFAESKRWWKVRAVSERFVILTSPFNLQRTVLYSVIDWERGVRGPDDHWSVGYETEEQIADALRRLQATGMDRIEVSWRAHSIRVKIAQVRSRAPSGQTCGEEFDESPACARIVCDRKVNANGKHTGKHIWHDPETGKPRVSWWRTA